MGPVEPKQFDRIGVEDYCGFVARCQSKNAIEENRSFGTIEIIRKTGARDGTRTRGLRRDRAAL
jgi:hypothetical protein